MPHASMKTLIVSRLAFPLAAFAGLATTACSSSSSSPAAPPADGGTAADSPASAAGYSVTIDLALAADSSGQIPLSNVQGQQSVAPGQVTGKMVYAVLYPEGMGPPNDMPIDNGGGLIESDLKAKIPLSSKHPSGSYEVAMVISLSGWTPGPTAPPAPQDLVAFTNPITAPPPSDGVPYTGKTIRFQVNAADTALQVDNTQFIEYGSATGGPPPPRDGGASDAGAE
jgi:hypothetical protein